MALVIPQQYTNPGRDSLGVVFAPISKPIRTAAGWMYEHVSPKDAGADNGSGEQGRTIQELQSENAQLRLRVASLSGQLTALQRLDVNRQRLGRLRDLCAPAPVVGVDSGSRQSLNLQDTSLDGLRLGQPVLYGAGLAGRIDRIGAGSAQVQLITDRNFRLTGAFAKFRKAANGAIEYARVALPPQLVVGQGGGALAIRDVPLREVRAVQLAAGDLVVLADDAWPMALQGCVLGRVVRVAPRRDQPLFAEILVRPVEDLLKLSEVMVLVKG